MANEATTTFETAAKRAQEHPEDDPILIAGLSPSSKTD